MKLFLCREGLFPQYSNVPSALPDLHLFHKIAEPGLYIGAPLTDLQLVSLRTVAELSSLIDNIIAVYCELIGLGRTKAGVRRMKGTLMAGLDEQSRLYQALSAGDIEHLPKGNFLYNLHVK